MPIDPVCGMEVSKDVKWKAEYQGKTYYFCCEHCYNTFLKNPAKFAK